MAGGHHSVTPYHYTFNSPVNYIDPLGLDTLPVKNLITKILPNSRPINSSDVFTLNEVGIQGKSRSSSAYNGILSGLQSDYQQSVGGLYMGNPDRLLTEAANTFHERYVAHNEINPFSGQGRVVGLQDANWIIDIAAGGVYGLTRSGSVAATEEGAHAVYQGFDKTGILRYVGITEREASVRFAEHLGSRTERAFLRYDIIPNATGLSRNTARVWEQNLINQYGLQKNGGLLLNKINSIASKNWLKYGIRP